MAVVPLLLLVAVIVLTYLPALALPLTDGVPRPRRDDITLSLSAVATALAVAATVFSAYLVMLMPPFVGFGLAASVAGLVGRKPMHFGLGAVAVYVTALAGWFGVSGIAGPTAFALVVVIPLATGALGAWSVSGIWRLRRRLGRRR